ncbi:MAG: hypothetical protein IIA55_12405 [Gemmatimonadetes bacterium]|nr:hypothetical protein [Gemmatimonadota bacterium]
MRPDLNQNTLYRIAGTGHRDEALDPDNQFTRLHTGEGIAARRKSERSSGAENPTKLADSPEREISGKRYHLHSSHAVESSK